jgi:hypothetical protein
MKFTNTKWSRYAMPVTPLVCWLALAQSQPQPRTPGERQHAAAPEPYDIGRGGFVPSGWMGDGEHNGLRLEAMSEDNPHSPPFCQRWEYLPVTNGDGWAAAAYQFPANNWGDKDGRDLSGKGYRELSVWARGIADSAGNYPVVQFKAGGGADPSKKYQATFEVQSEFITLTPAWKRYSISVAGKDLRRVIAALTIVLRAEDNPHGAVFYLDDCAYQ